MNGNAPPPQAVPPPPAGHAAGSLEGWLKHARYVLAGVLLVAGATASALGVVQARDGKADKALAVAEKALDVAERADANGKLLTAGMAQMRQDTEKQVREFQAAMDKRFEDFARTRAEDREALIRMQEQLRNVGAQVQESRGDLRVVLDRLNVPPRARNARDYP